MGTLRVEMSGRSIPPLYILLLYLLVSKARNFLDSEDDFLCAYFQVGTSISLQPDGTVEDDQSGNR